MKFRTLLLGTAAAFAVSGGAQAADLALAVEPIDYVKICDAFGAGYYYIPGTDTCLSVGGYVEFNVKVYDHDPVGNIYGSIGGINEDEVADEFGNFHVEPMMDSYQQSWEFKTEAGANFNARSMSDLGVIATSMNFVTLSENDDYNGHTKTVRFDGGYGAIGPMMFGWTTSTFDPGGGYTMDGSLRSDKKTDQFRLSYLMGTWGIMLGLEDPRDRYDGPKNATGDYPDIILAVTGGAGGFDLRAAVGVTDRTSGTGWGANLTATAKLGVAEIKGTVTYSDNFKSLAEGNNCSGSCDDGEWWSMFVSGAVALSGNLKAVGTVSWLDGNGGASYTQQGRLEAALGLQYATSASSSIAIEALYKDPEGPGPEGEEHIEGRLRFKTEFQ